MVNKYIWNKRFLIFVEQYQKKTIEKYSIKIKMELKNKNKLF
jgi:hypothetical protein